MSWLDQYMMQPKPAPSAGVTPGWGLGATGQVGEDAGMGLPQSSAAEDQASWRNRQVSDAEQPPAEQFAPPTLQVQNTQNMSTSPSAPALGWRKAEGLGEGAGVGEDLGAKPEGATWSQTISKMLGGMGSGMAAGGQQQRTRKWGEDWSDVRLKEDIKPARGEARSLLRAVAAEGPMSYRYKEEVGVPGEQFGPMAQTLEKGGPMGKAMVGKGADGMRYLEPIAMQKATLAMIAEQQRQLDDLKAGGGMNLRSLAPAARRVRGWFNTTSAEAAPSSRRPSPASEPWEPVGWRDGVEWDPEDKSWQGIVGRSKR